jgi:hypothetical protein
MIWFLIPQNDRAAMFGDLSDLSDEAESGEKVVWEENKIPCRAPVDGDVFLVKLPNFLSIDPK